MRIGNAYRTLVDGVQTYNQRDIARACGVSPALVTLWLRDGKFTGDLVDYRGKPKWSLEAFNAIVAKFATKKVVDD